MDLRQGEKIFYLIEPTDTNLQLYEDWVTSPNQNEVFLADKVKTCYKCKVKQGLHAHFSYSFAYILTCYSHKLPRISPILQPDNTKYLFDLHRMYTNREQVNVLYTCRGQRCCDVGVGSRVQVRRSFCRRAGSTPS